MPVPACITRGFPDVRSTNVDKTVGFYTELLGFDVRRDEGDGRVVAFVSPTHPGVEVTLNRDGFSLPPGFTVEVDSFDAVVDLRSRAAGEHVRVIEERTTTSRRFAVLDPSGRRVTIAAAPSERAEATSGDDARTITRAIPGVTTNDLDATRRFYVDYLGFDAHVATDDLAIFRAPGSAAQVIGSTMVSASPDGFDLDVGTIDRVDGIFDAANGAWMLLGPPSDSPREGIRCFTVFDPNGVGINVAAHVGT